MPEDQNNKQPQADPMFMSLLLSLEASTMQALGKIVNPVTQKTEKNLQQAQMTIDMLAMLEKKTTGNLTQDEDGLLKRVLYQLRMNYLDELNREKDRPDSESSENQAQSEESTEESEADSREDENNRENQ
jgi:hypothetical protein